MIQSDQSISAQTVNQSSGLSPYLATEVTQFRKMNYCKGKQIDHMSKLSSSILLAVVSVADIEDNRHTF